VLAWCGAARATTAAARAQPAGPPTAR
jgi:hypothetical protein